METNTNTWTKVQRGFYKLDGTRYAVVASYDEVSSDSHYDRTGYQMVSRVEWASVRDTERDDHNTGTNLNWFDTMKEARADCEYRARQDRRNA